MTLAVLVCHVLVELLASPLVGYMGELLEARTFEDLAVRSELAAAIEAVTADDGERRQLAKIARYESAFRRDVATCAVRGPQGELGAWQILPRSVAERDALCRTLEGDARIALARVRESIAACRHLPPPERLAIYTRGRCDSREGRRLSRHRWAGSMQ